MVLHGAGGSPERIMRRLGFVEAAARHGFAAVFPRGLDRQWNDGREFRRSHIDDVGFLQSLAGELARRGIADPARLYIAGISNGGMMTFRMLCDAAGLFAGAATVIASMPDAVGERCRPERPVPVVMLNGTADPLVPYDGGEVGFRGGRGSVWAAERTAAFLARSNGCEGPSKMPLPVPAGSAAADSVRAIRLEWSACSSGRGVTLYRLEGAGHQVFGGEAVFAGLLGPGTRQISAVETIMSAFAFLEKAPR
jgi:polyhydroxybutyrate depolymerase